MPTLTQIQEAAKGAGWKTLTPQDIQNAQKYGTGIFSATVKKIQGDTTPVTSNPQSYADYINQAFQNPDYQRAQTELKTFTDQAPNYLANKQTELQNSDPALQQLQSERAKLAGQLYSAPFTARANTSDIFDPIKREALVSQAIGNVLGQLQGTGSLIQQRQGAQNQLAERAYNIFKSQLDSKQTGVTNMRSTLKDVAEKEYASKTKSQDRLQSLQDKMNMYLFEQSNKKYKGSDNNSSVYDPLAYATDMLNAAEVGGDTFDPVGYLSSIVPNKGTLRNEVYSTFLKKLSEDKASKTASELAAAETAKQAQENKPKSRLVSPDAGIVKFGDWWNKNIKNSDWNTGKPKKK